MGGNRDSDFQHRVDHIGGAHARDAIAVASVTSVVHSPKQLFDIAGRGVGIQDRQEMKSAVHRDFDARKQVQLAEACDGQGFHL